MLSSNESSLNPFDLLKGKTLVLVSFIHDYVQFGFENDLGLSAYTRPTVWKDGKELSWGQHGYRDMLCDRINGRVMGSEKTSDRLAIFFEDDATVFISLRNDDYRGPEAFQFTDGKGMMVIE